MANFCLPALGVRGLLGLKRLGSNHKNRASALLHAPTCPTVGEGREDEASHFMEIDVPILREEEHAHVSKSCNELLNSS